MTVISSVNMFRKSSSLIKVLGKNVMKAMGLDMRSIKQRGAGEECDESYGSGHAIHQAEISNFCCNQFCECVQ
jgi:hypothetical protein